MTQVQNIQQQRAKHALKAVHQWQTDRQLDANKLKSYASDLPAMIITNGLGQAIAFCMTKKESEYEALRKTLQEWLVKEKNIFKQPNKELINAIMESDMQTYQMAQAEALVYLDWVKKLTKGLMQEEQ